MASDEDHDAASYESSASSSSEDTVLIPRSLQQRHRRKLQEQQQMELQRKEKEHAQEPKPSRPRGNSRDDEDTPATKKDAAERGIHTGGGSTTAGSISTAPPAAARPGKSPLRTSIGNIKVDQICGICEKGGDDLYVCTGSCVSAFHAACLATVPFSSPSRDQWMCPSCRSHTHVCFHCKQRGLADGASVDASLQPSEGSTSESGSMGSGVIGGAPYTASGGDEMRAVVKCRALSCGKYYHQDCIAKLPLARIAGTRFICPLHTCAACEQSGAKKEPVRCMRCPVAYHTSCLPPKGVTSLPGKRILCPAHDGIPPPLQSNSSQSTSTSGLDTAVLAADIRADMAFPASSAAKKDGQDVSKLALPALKRIFSSDADSAASSPRTDDNEDARSDTSITGVSSERKHSKSSKKEKKKKKKKRKKLKKKERERSGSHRHDTEDGDERPSKRSKVGRRKDDASADEEEKRAVSDDAVEGTQGRESKETTEVDEDERKRVKLEAADAIFGVEQEQDGSRVRASQERNQSDVDTRSVGSPTKPETVSEQDTEPLQSFRTKSDEADSFEQPMAMVRDGDKSLKHQRSASVRGEDVSNSSSMLPATILDVKKENMNRSIASSTESNPRTEYHSGQDGSDSPTSSSPKRINSAVPLNHKDNLPDQVSMVAHSNDAQVERAGEVSSVLTEPSSSPVKELPHPHDNPMKTDSTAVASEIAINSKPPSQLGSLDAERNDDGSARGDDARDDDAGGRDTGDEEYMDAMPLSALQTVSSRAHQSRTASQASSKTRVAGKPTGDVAKEKPSAGSSRSKKKKKKKGKSGDKKMESEGTALVTVGGEDPEDGIDEQDGDEAKWVQCDDCKKWRTVPREVDLDLMPDKWFCHMNTWAREFAMCSVPEEADDSKTRTTKRSRSNVPTTVQPTSKKSKSGQRHTAAGSDLIPPVDAAKTEAVSSGGGNDSGGASDKGRDKEKSSSSKSVKRPDKDSKKRKLKDKLKEKYGAVKWVQCEDAQCGKWRVVPPSIDFDLLPAVWYCQLNTWDPSLATCSASNPSDVDTYLSKSQSKKQLASNRPSKKHKSLNHPAGAGSGSGINDGGANSSNAVAGNTDSAHQVKTVGKSSKGSTPTGHGSAVPSSSGNSSGKIEVGSGTAKASKSLSIVVGSHPNNAGDSRGGPLVELASKSRNRGPLGSLKSTVLEWAQCEKCNKWRKLPAHIKSSKLPDKWYCTMNNWDPSRASCSAPQEEDQEPLVDASPLPNSQPWYLPGQVGGSATTSVGLRSKRGKLSYSELLYASTGHLRKMYTSDSSTLSFEYEGVTYYRDEQYKKSCMYTSPPTANKVNGASSNCHVVGSSTTSSSSSSGHAPGSQVRSQENDRSRAGKARQTVVNQIASEILETLDLRRDHSITEIVDAVVNGSSGVSKNLSLDLITSALTQLITLGMVEKVNHPVSASGVNDTDASSSSASRTRTTLLPASAATSFMAALSRPAYYRKVPKRPLKAMKAWKQAAAVLEAVGSVTP